MICILDFGSQYTHLLQKALRVYSLNHCNSNSVILPANTKFSGIKEKYPDCRGIILSGSPKSVNNSNAVIFDSEILNQVQIPVFGICYGFGLIVKHYGGKMEENYSNFFGSTNVVYRRVKNSLDVNSSEYYLFKNIDGSKVWMSCHEVLNINNCPKCLNPVLVEQVIPFRESDKAVLGLKHIEKNQFGFQFHPEVSDTEKSKEIIKFMLSKMQSGSEMQSENEMQQSYGSVLNKEFLEIDKIILNLQKLMRGKIEKGQKGVVVSFISGGVDSFIATMLSKLAFSSLLMEGYDVEVLPIYVDNGLMRKGESDEIYDALQSSFDRFEMLGKRQYFLDSLVGVSDAEEKRKIVGQCFVNIFLQKMQEIENFVDYKGRSPVVFLCQGTLYTDFIESGKATAESHNIKSHHNVSNPILEEKRANGFLLEPNIGLYKDDVRRIGAALKYYRNDTKYKIPDFVLKRHPFPGPGLSIRIVGEVTAEKLEILRQADFMYIEMLRNLGLYDKIWQAFATLIPGPYVGVAGDCRTTGFAICLRAVNSVDGMTCSAYDFDGKDLKYICCNICNKVRGVTRVFYDVSSKPPGTIELM